MKEAIKNETLYIIRFLNNSGVRICEFYGLKEKNIVYSKHNKVISIYIHRNITKTDAGER